MKKTTFLIVGKHAVVEALKNPKRKIEKVFVTEDAQKTLNRENQSLNLFKGVSVFYKSRRELDNICGRDEIAHQGLVAEADASKNQKSSEGKAPSCNVRMRRASSTGSLHLTHVGNEVSPLFLLLDASEHHLGARDILLRVQQVFVEMLVGPHDGRVFVCL